MKILHVIEFLKKGGAERQLYLLSKSQNNKHFIAHLDPNSSLAAKDYPLSVELISLLNEGFFSIYRQVLDLIVKNQIDIVQLWLPEKITIPALLASKIANVKVISCDRRSPVNYGIMAIRDRMKYVNHLLCDSLIFNYFPDHQQHPLLSLIYKLKNGKTIANGFEAGKYLDISRPYISKDILYAGRLVKQKRVDLLVRASSRLIREGAIRQVHIVGSGPERAYLEALNRESGGHCIFHGEIRNWTEQFNPLNSIFILPSDAEGMPNALFEALLSGFLTITSDIHQVTQWFEGLPLMRFAAGDEAALVTSVESILVMSQLKKREMIEKLYRAAQEFSIESMIAKYDEVYAGLLYA